MRLFTACLTLAILLALPALGILKISVASLLFLAISAGICAYGLRPNWYASGWGKCGFLLLSVSLSLILVDVGGRVLLRGVLWPRATALYESRWPPLPLVHRYAANVHYHGRVSGDLASTIGFGSDREQRDEVFTTDDHGFRNDVSIVNPLDLIILGDSMTDGNNTTQRETLTDIFRAEYGYHTYNLSMSGVGPWEEYMNFALEGGRLPIKPTRTVLLWGIFTGNDLDDPCLPLLEPSQLPRGSRMGQWLVRYEAFRTRSPALRVRVGVESFVRSTVGEPFEPDLVLRANFLDGTKMLFLRDYVERRRRDEDAVRNHPNYSCIAATIAAMKRLADRTRVKVVVAVIPSKAEVYGWVVDHRAAWSSGTEPSGLAQVLEDLARQEGFGFIDLKGPLVNASRREWEQSGRLLWWRDDIHWNGIGQRTAAAIVNGVLPTLISHHD